MDRKSSKGDQYWMDCEFCFRRSPSSGEIRPAIVVKVFPGAMFPMCNLQVFTDSSEKGFNNDELPSLMWKTSVPYDSEGEKHSTWHIPRDVGTLYLLREVFK